MSLQSQLKSHLEAFDSAPFLFVGSGLSRRYLGSDDWNSLLSHFADQLARPYARYFADANGHLPEVASAIANDFADLWWDEPRYAVSRKNHPAPSGRDSPLKIEVAKRIALSLDNLPQHGPLAEEIALLREAVVEGVITTNYDNFLESIFPDFVAFLGQEELLFNNTYGVGEIYKIHGGVDAPESLVLTAADYTRFRDRDRYLAAKLLTFFVEHPVVFVGYSLSDSNIQEILRSLVGILTEKNLAKLQDRLVFVQWSKDSPSSSLSKSWVSVDGTQIPIWSVEVNDFREVYAALGLLRRTLPARVIRRAREQVYELAFESTAREKIYVEDLDASVDASRVEVVIGVGLRDRLAAEGLIGWDRTRVLDEVLEPVMGGRKEAMKSFSERGLMNHLNGATNTPVFYFLRNSGFLDDSGRLLPDVSVDSRISARVENIESILQSPRSVERANRSRAATYENFEHLAAVEEPTVAMTLALCLRPEQIDLDFLRRYLIDNRETTASGKPTTAWAKAVCLYDWLRFGRSRSQNGSS